MSKRSTRWRSPIPEADLLRAILRLLAHEPSRDIIRRLTQRPSDVPTLAKQLGRPSSTIRANLIRLAECHIVETAQVNPKRLYRLAKTVTVHDRPKTIRVTVRTPGGSAIAIKLLHRVR